MQTFLHSLEEEAYLQKVLSYRCKLAAARRPQACCKRTPGKVQKDLAAAGRCYFGSLRLYQQLGEAIKPEYFTFYDFAA